MAGGGPTTQREVLTIEDSLIDDNFAFEGGGVEVISGDFGAPTGDTITITGAHISNNTVISGDGGGLYAELFGAQLSVTSSTISGNEAGEGGGLWARVWNGAYL